MRFFKVRDIDTIIEPGEKEHQTDVSSALKRFGDLDQWHFRDYFIICKISQKWWHAGRFWENCPVFFTLFFKKRDSWFFLIIEWLWEFRRSFYLIGNFVIRKDLVFYLSSVAVSYIRKIHSILLFDCIFLKNDLTVCPEFPM